MAGDKDRLQEMKPYLDSRLATDLKLEGTHAIDDALQADARGHIRNAGENLIEARLVGTFTVTNGKGIELRGEGFPKGIEDWARDMVALERVKNEIGTPPRTA